MFEELDYCHTPLGELILRRRTIPMLENSLVHEIILNGEFLMSSLFHEVEDALARLAVAASPEGPLDIVVGGLGLGFTAAAALESPRVKSLSIVEFLAPVVRWHRDRLVPLGQALTSDPRARFVIGDFFKMAASEDGFDPGVPGRIFDAVLLDIDHTPDHWLAPAHAAFYSEDGLRSLCRHLRNGGVFAMWSDAPPGKAFVRLLESVFARVDARVIPFENPIRGGESSGTVYVCHFIPVRGAL